MTVAHQANEGRSDVESRRAGRRRLVNTAYVAVTIVVLCWGVVDPTGRGLFFSRGYGDSFSDLLWGQLWFLLNCLLCLAVQCVFMVRGLRQRLLPAVVTTMTVASAIAAGVVGCLWIYLSMGWVVNVEEGAAVAVLRIVSIPFAFGAVLLITTAASRAVRMTLDPTPRWPIAVGIVMTCLVGVNLTGILAGWPYPS